MLNKIIADIQSWIEKSERLRRTRRELSLLSDRDLHDIGISRCDIDRVAKENVRPINVAI